MTTSLEDTLVDVRRAYRLIADYQQRLIELLAFIRSELGATPYHQYFRKKSPKKFAGLETSVDAGIRFLPLLDVSVLSLRNDGQEAAYDNHRPGDLLIAIDFISDSGTSEYYKHMSIKTAEESSSELSIQFIVCDEPVSAPFNWYYKVWGKFGIDILNEAYSREEIPGYRGYRENISLSKFADEQSIRDEIAALRQRASKKLGIEI